MDDLIIRIAGLQDAALIADLSRETFYNAFAPANTEADMAKFMRENFSRQQLMDEVVSQENIFLIAFINEEAAGYTRLKDNSIPETNLESNNVIEISRIYTSTQKIGKGIGAALMDKSISVAKEKQRDFIWLGVWEHNVKAIRFYERFGFEKFGEHPFVLGSDVQTDWLMAKKL